MDALDRLVTVGATRELDEEGSATGGCILATDEVGTKESEEVGPATRGVGGPEKEGLAAGRVWGMEEVATTGWE